MDPKDLLKPGAIVLGIAAAGALGFAAGFVVARDPKVLRRMARALAGGVERMTGALAESREELADLWAEVRADARHDVEAATFASAATAAEATEHEPRRPARRARTAGAKGAKGATRH